MFDAPDPATSQHLPSQACGGLNFFSDFRPHPPVETISTLCYSSFNNDSFFSVLSSFTRRKTVLPTTPRRSDVCPSRSRCTTPTWWSEDGRWRPSNCCWAPSETSSPRTRDSNEVRMHTLKRSFAEGSSWVKNYGDFSFFFSRYKYTLWSGYSGYTALLYQIALKCEEKKSNWLWKKV